MLQHWMCNKQDDVKSRHSGKVRRWMYMYASVESGRISQQKSFLDNEHIYEEMSVAWVQ